MRRLYIVGVAALLAACGETVPNFTSEYTTIDRDKCTLLSRDEEMQTASWRCQSFRGIEVQVSKGDLRDYLSFGKRSDDIWPSNQTLASYNKLGKTLEWRLASFGDQWVPVATIVRYFTRVPNGEDEFIEGEVIVVSKFDDMETCQMAYVDVLSNDDAIGLARQAADTYVLDFECDRDQTMRIGLPGPSLPGDRSASNQD